MILFFVGVIEMAVSAWWTRSVSKSDVLTTGMITGVHLLIWFFVLQQVVDNLHDWTTVIPYMLGCMGGSMLAVADMRRIKRRVKKAIRLARLRNAGKKAASVSYPTVVEYERLR